jgi:hypothetical protein
MAAVAGGASAQQVVGSWEYIPMFGNTAQRLVDTPQTVFAVSQSSLSAYDKSTGELISYSTANYLSDTGVNCLWYNFDRKYLFIAYSDGNIDLLYDNGRVVNIPDIYNAALTSGKTINDVAFDGDIIYVATDFGLVTINEARSIVVESGLYNQAMYAVAVCGDYLYMSNASKTYIAPKADNHNRLSAFTEAGGGFRDFENVGSDEFMIGANNDQIYKVTPKADYSGVSWTQLSSGSGHGFYTSSQLPGSRISRTKDGGAVVCSSPYNTQSRLLIVASDGTLKGDYSLASALKQNAMGSWAGSTYDVWALSSIGIGEYKLTSAGTAIDETLTTPFRPNAITGPNVGNVARTDDGTWYFMTQGEDNSNTLAYRGNVSLDICDNGKFSSIMPSAITYGYEFCPLPQLGKGSFALATRSCVLIAYPDGTFEKYTKANSSLRDPVATNVYMVADIHCDPDGNLWMYQNHQTAASAPDLHILPLAALKNKPDSADWKSLDMGVLGTGHSISFLIHSSGIVLFSTRTGMVGVNTNKDWLNVDNFKVSSKQTFSLDSDGASFDPSYIYHMIEDKNGWVWCATSDGVAIIKNPAELFTTSFALSRPKVPRNDGTNLADYLLTGVDVLRIYVDANNEKWIATDGSGLYHVNADGTKILETYTTDNSKIISNTVYVAYPDPESNDVYVGTDVGLQIYHSASAPAADDFSDVRVYPNPVTPDYTGWITIDGLMDGSLVKISDAAGKVFHVDTSTGGMLLWDGCDASGNRVKSGVYFVHATQNASGSSSGVVAKILVIN